jgi:hypothetical protein
MVSQRPLARPDPNVGNATGPLDLLALFGNGPCPAQPRGIEVASAVEMGGTGLEPVTPSLSIVPGR